MQIIYKALKKQQSPGAGNAVRFIVIIVISQYGLRHLAYELMEMFRRSYDNAH